MKPIKQTNVLWAVYDENKKVVLKQDMPLEELVDFLLEDKREELTEQLKFYIPEYTWLQVQFEGGLLKCCDCNGILDQYNQKWPLERQRCKLCVSKY